jgi:hypothetical protein
LEDLGAVFTEAGPVNVGRKRQHPSPRIDHLVSNLVSATCNWYLSKAPAQTMRMMMGLYSYFSYRRGREDRERRRMTNLPPSESNAAHNVATAPACTHFSPFLVSIIHDVR